MMRTALVVMAALATSAAHAQTPDGENGRYSLSPLPDGVVRLDTRTGAMTTCTARGCFIMPDERAALESDLARLQRDGEALRGLLAQRDADLQTKESALKQRDSLIAQRDGEVAALREKLAAPPAKTEDAMPKSDPLPPQANAERKLEIPLPSDRDMDRAMNFLESAWRRLIEMTARWQPKTDGTGKI